MTRDEIAAQKIQGWIEPGTDKGGVLVLLARMSIADDGPTLYIDMLSGVNVPFDICRRLLYASYDPIHMFDHGLELLEQHEDDDPYFLVVRWEYEFSMQTYAKNTTVILTGVVSADEATSE